MKYQITWASAKTHTRIQSSLLNLKIKENKKNLGNISLSGLTSIVAKSIYQAYSQKFLNNSRGKAKIIKELRDSMSNNNLILFMYELFIFSINLK